MAGKIAVAIVHGIGAQRVEEIDSSNGEPDYEGFERDMKRKIHDYCRPVCGDDVENEIVIEGVHWADVLNTKQTELRDRLQLEETKTDYLQLRDFLLTFASDAIAYRSPGTWVYDGIHTIFAKTLHRLAKKTAPYAPLCVISHSLGTVIASNYFYDLQRDDPLGSNRNIPGTARHAMGGRPTPLERGHTLSYFYTLGSPLAMFSILWRDFGDPIQMPPPHWPFYATNVPHEWINYYDKDDVLGFPLKDLNPRYQQVVTRDEQVPVGGFLSGKTPLSHLQYWTDKDIINPISERLTQMWLAVENQHIDIFNPPS
jgi:hypothetical protein